MAEMNILLLASILQMFVGVFTTPAQIPSAAGTSGQLLKVLTTNDKIWLYKRTNKTNEHKCLYWQKTSFTNAGNTYNFEEVYWTPAKKTSKLEGTITSRPDSRIQGAALKVEGPSEEGNNIEYLLVTWNQTYNCGIFYTEIEKAGQRERQTCGLYFWEVSVDNQDALTNCDQDYKHYCTEYKTSEQVLYGSTCKQLQGC
uniref:Lipocalin n=1 Tax=Rhipicephalus appendiculatus TaxID=34631 RepID=A0A131YF18_RHIAP